MPSGLHTSFGRYQVAETPSSLATLHFHTDDIALKEVDWEPKLAVLDQEDLLQQGIDCTQLVPGAQAGIDALGSCTANANTAALSNLLSQDDFLKLLGAFNPNGTASYTDTVAGEKFAVVFYHSCTDQTGDPSQEWPPTDCGSSGLYVVQENERLGFCGGAKVATGALGIVSLMQLGQGLIVGQPWFNSWMGPDANAFIDGDGSAQALQTAINSGVAGGHETHLSAIEKLAFQPGSGQIDPFKTVIRFRNSWTSSWGDHGSYRAHLSTYVALSSYCDFRQLQPKAA